MSVTSTRTAFGIAALTMGLWSILASDNSLESSSAEGVAYQPVSSTATNDLHKVLGISRAGCDGCHYEETETWMKTAHYSSADTLLRFTGNTRKYANALGIRADELMTTSMCADCHGTKAVVNNRIEVISGVSCESCHGPSGGEPGWANRHQSYDPVGAATRQEESIAHRAERQADCDAAGMIRPENIAGLVRKCLACHIISDEKLVAAGHKAFSNFDFNSWTSGDIRHNFLLDDETNREAPSLWLERTGSTVVQRRRLKFVAGTLVSLEVALRKRAEVSDPTVIPSLGGFAAAMNGKLAQINAAGGTPETRAATELFAPMRDSIFVVQATDNQVYSAAADKIAALTKLFLEHNDGAKLKSLDAIISVTPPHYSQHFKDRSYP
ncbi:MAG TPA: multiheme c-type cytochrome [Planctomycetaceae bacterium]|nr:multiheme c-type cytochrome [Planctomycetaceae bacterium]